LNAAELTNSTGKILDGGPITVYDSGAYAGEALVETVKSGDKRLISYGVDLGTRITTRFDFGDEILQEIHYRRGVLETRVAHRTSKTYTIKNIDAKAKTLIIEHPVRPGHKLVSLKPTETTATAWRFEVKLPPQAEQRFPVDEENLIAQSYAVINLTPDMIVNWISGKNIPASAKQGLQRILDKKRQIAKLDQQIQQNQQQIDESTRDQARIRENLGALNRVAGQQEIVQKYANQLASREADLATLRDSTADLRKQRTAAQSELDTLVEF
jgi:hypothetical protein